MLHHSLQYNWLVTIPKWYILYIRSKSAVCLSTVPIRHTVPLSHTIYPYQQFLSVTQSHCHTQYIPINSSYPSHSPTFTHNISLSVTQSHCHTQYIHSLFINSIHIALFNSISSHISCLLKQFQTPVSCQTLYITAWLCVKIYDQVVVVLQWYNSASSIIK